MKVKSSPINWKHIQRELNPMKPATKVLTLMQKPTDYCAFMRLLYAAGYRIVKTASYPRCITLDMNTFGYIECRDNVKSAYKFVVYGYTRKCNNARVIWLKKGE